MPWCRDLFDSPPIPVNGEMTVPTVPGLGLAFKKAIDQGFKAT